MAFRKCGFLLRRTLLLASVCACFLGARGVSQSQKSPATIADQLSTSEHVRKPGWWPTKGSFARKDFVGTEACVRCHGDIVATQKDSAMAMTASLAANSAILRAHSLEYQWGPYTYRASVLNDAATYSVTDGSQSVTGLLTWAFGIRMGQSFFFDHNDRTYLVPLTFYPEPKAYSYTVDQPHSPPDSLIKAVGRPLPDDAIHGCFDCHTTASTTGGHFDTAQAIPGVTCEACHGPGADHLAAAKSGLLEQGTTLILNPKHMKPVEAVDFCGACHRTWWDVTLGDAAGAKSLRFQPYRIENSRCWGKGDARITCTACHDPHRPLVREAATYDSKCLSCHVNGVGAKPTADHPGPPCPKSTRDCVTCHMPQYQVIDIPVKFTDHQIRVVHPGDVIPE